MKGPLLIRLALGIRLAAHGDGAGSVLDAPTNAKALKVVVSGLNVLAATVARTGEFVSHGMLPVSASMAANMAQSAPSLGHADIFLGGHGML